MHLWLMRGSLENIHGSFSLWVLLAAVLSIIQILFIVLIQINSISTIFISDVCNFY